MTLSRLVLASLFFLCILESPPVRADDTDGLLTVSGRVLLPDGSPAAGATVRLQYAHEGDRASAVRTDEAGAFQLRGIFGNGARFHAISADGRHQAVRFVSAGGARRVFAAPVELALALADTHEVTVMAEGRPASEVHVLAQGNDFQVQTVTNRVGKAILRIPAKERVRELVAWHPTLGIDGTRNLDAGLSQNSTEMSLRMPRPHTIRMVDPSGRGVGDVEFGFSVRPENAEWIVTHELAAAHVRTAADGTAIVPWMPREKLQYVEPRLAGGDWKIDDYNPQPTGERTTTVHVRRKIAVSGRLIMPHGASAEGILVTGFGFGPKNNGDIPYARARRDGSFTLRIPSDHGYVLGITDLEWASNLWSGLILRTDSAEPAEITIAAEPATPVTVRVTRGPAKEPVIDAWVELSKRGNMEWVDSSGQKRRGSAKTRGGGARTDANGLATLGVPRGSQQCRLSSDKWSDERTIDIASSDPVVVEFHRNWLADRKVTGRLMINGVPYKPSPQVAGRAWIQPSPYKTVQIEPQVRADGSFDVTFDAANLSLLFVDSGQNRSGFAHIGPEDSVVELNMQPTATYSGTLLDENNRHLADRTLVLSVAQSFPAVIVAQAGTDRAGEFQFTGLPANVPLDLQIERTKDGPQYYVSDRGRLFEPGEARDHDRVKLDSNNSTRQVAQVTLPLTERVQRVCRDGRLNGMHALVILQGDDSPETLKAAGHMLDFEAVKAVLGYLTVRLTAEQIKAEKNAIDGFGWPQPAAGEIALVVLGGDGKSIASERLAAADVSLAETRGAEFMKTHHPSGRDALELLAEAKKEAQATNRHVWVVLGGPRCGPCFRLARWMDDHRTFLEKDYVVVKLLEVIDRHVEDVTRQLKPAAPGIPWYAILDPDGKILITSDGPLGNIGIPATIEGQRHFRRMLEKTAQRLTPVAINALMKSLATEK